MINYLKSCVYMQVLCKTIEGVGALAVTAGTYLIHFHEKHPLIVHNFLYQQYIMHSQILYRPSLTIVNQIQHMIQFNVRILMTCIWEQLTTFTRRFWKLLFFSILCKYGNTEIMPISSSAVIGETFLFSINDYTEDMVTFMLWKFIPPKVCLMSQSWDNVASLAIK